jgi:hypothetical protein
MLACALGLAGCAAREVTPVAMSQPGDEALSCDALKAQIAANGADEVRYRIKDRQVENGNAVRTVGSAVPFVGPLIAGSSDFSNEEQVKARALADRNEQLNYLAKRKGC